jgi:HAAS domain-containing protein
LSPIERYLQALDAQLQVPRRNRRRILAEARDHLEEAAASGTEQLAVCCFGEPREVAARFHEQVAGSSASRASVRTVALMLAFLVAAALAARGRLNTFPFGLVVFLAGQVAVVASAIGAARWLRYRHEGWIPPERLADAYRANGLAVACVALAAAAELANALTHSWAAGYAIGAGVVLCASLFAGWSVLGAVARARAIAAAGAPAEDALDDMLAVGRVALASAERRLPTLSRLARIAESAVREAEERAPQLTRWLDLRRSPWRFCAIFAAACGLALAAGHGVTDGGGALTLQNAGRAVAGGLMIAGIEATAVLLAFAAFGRFLGIRR